MPTLAITLNTSWNIYNFRRPLIDALQENGYTVIIFSPQDDSTDKLVQLGYTVIPITKLSRKGTNPLNDLQLIKELSKLYREHDIDLAIHYTIKPNIYGSIAAHRIGIPSMAVVTGLGYTFLSSGIAARVAKRLYRYAFKRNNITIFQNPDDRKLFIGTKLVAKEKSALIYGSGIDTTTFSAEPKRKITGNILFVGRLLHDKGIRELIAGFNTYASRDDSVTLHIVGDVDQGNPASLSEAEISMMHTPQIKFHGFQSDVRSFIQDADVVILPSYREGLPRTMLEALAMSRPVITTDVPGCREVVIDGKNGYMIPSHDAPAITTAIEKFYALSDEERVTMGETSRKLALKKFDCDIVNERMLGLVRRFDW